MLSDRAGPDGYALFVFGLFLGVVLTGAAFGLWKSAAARSLGRKRVRSARAAWRQVGRDASPEVLAESLPDEGLQPPTVPAESTAPLVLLGIGIAAFAYRLQHRRRKERAANDDAAVETQDPYEG